MCRFVLYLGREIDIGALVTEPVNAIIHQSYRSRERTEPLNGDGFGLAWYVPDATDRPALFRDVTPAWNNQNLLHLARVTRSRTILAHVRAASPGSPVTQLNCHPFVWENLVFMHNGVVGGFARVRRELLAGLSDTAFGLIAGSTDSEHLFALFVDRYQALADRDSPACRLGEALEETVRTVEALCGRAGVTDPSLLNLAVTDGHCAAVSRHHSALPQEANSLYVHQGCRYTCVEGVCRMIPATEGRGTVIVASEPLSEDPGWVPVPPNASVRITADLTVSVAPFATGSDGVG